MSYLIKKADSTQLTIPEDAMDKRFYDESASKGVQLIGRNASEYGTVLAQDLVQMLEHFASPVAPTTATSTIGQMWFDTSTSTMKVFKSTGWEAVGGSASGETAIIDPNVRILYSTSTGAYVEAQIASLILPKSGYISVSGTCSFAPVGDKLNGTFDLGGLVGLARLDNIRVAEGLAPIYSPVIRSTVDGIPYPNFMTTPILGNVNQGFIASISCTNMWVQVTAGQTLTLSAVIYIAGTATNDWKLSVEPGSKSQALSYHYL